ncbi:hypothetical protein N7G274_000293 [Stereocaulon virgatum]|uniref:Peroxisomal biogenesis factor 11 n=1 Tax=Stereocaulon virgatum TaxID=373712 RepID=A0ABR4ARP8_9LECA
MASSSSPPSKAMANPRGLLSIYLSKTTSTIAHLNRLLSTTSHLDTTLLTTTYTLHLLHSLLTHRPHLSPRLARLTSSLTPLTSLLDELRIILRLWGLLGIYTWGASTYLHPPKDAVVKAITWSQVCACAVYQALENGAYLSSRGVMGWGKERVAKAWVWSGRMWMVHVGLELVRLGYEFSQFGSAGERMAEGKKEDVEGSGVVGGEKGEVVVVVGRDGEEKQRWERWRREVVVNAAYAPMTVHYSLEEGPLSEGAIGALGVVVAWLTFGKAWKETA